MYGNVVKSVISTYITAPADETHLLFAFLALPVKNNQYVKIRW